MHHAMLCCMGTCSCCARCWRCAAVLRCVEAVLASMLQQTLLISSACFTAFMVAQWSCSLVCCFSCCFVSWIQLGMAFSHLPQMLNCQLY